MENDDEQIEEDIIRSRLRERGSLVDRSPTGRIVEGIKSRGSGKGDRQQQRNLPAIVNTEEPIGRQIFEVGVGRPLPIIYDNNPGLSDISRILKDVNDGQRELDKINRMDGSELYKAWVGGVDFVKGLFGKNKTTSTIHDLFERQQYNVNGLNQALVTMTTSYEPEVKRTHDALDKIIESNEQEHKERMLVETKEIPPEIEKYNSAIEKLESMKENNADYRDDPEYFSTLRNVIAAKRETRLLGYERRVAIMGDEHHAMDIDNLQWQEELFQTTLFRVMEMAYLTSLYQQTLENNERIWNATIGLSTAVRDVKEGVSVLSDFNRQLNDTYINAVAEINEIVNNHPNQLEMQTTNTNIRRLVQDVHTDLYRSELGNSPSKLIGSSE